MTKLLHILSLSLIFYGTNCFALDENFNVFSYLPPEFFTKTNLPSGLEFNLTDNDTSFCIITLYKSQPAKDSVIHDVKDQWNEYVLKQSGEADKKPIRIYTELMWDAWVSTVAVGNFYQNKKIGGDAKFIQKR